MPKMRTGSKPSSALDSGRDLWDMGGVEGLDGTAGDTGRSITEDAVFVALKAFKPANPAANVLIGGGATMDNTRGAGRSERARTDTEKPLTVEHKATRATTAARNSMVRVILNLFCFRT